jgi:hypothetical protein
MTKLQSLEQVEEKLRTAAEGGDFASAQSAALDYVRAVELAAAGLPRAAAASSIRRAMAAVEAARRQLCVARARLARRLRAEECRLRFQPASMVTNTWRIDA